MSSFWNLLTNVLVAMACMQADTSPDSSNLVKFRREYETFCQGIDPAQAVVVGNDSTEDMSARLIGVETHLVTDYLIGDAVSSGADHISDSLGFESWVLANY